MTTRPATMRAARAALLALLLVAATGGSALGAGGKRAGVPTFDGAQEIVVRKQVMKVLKAHGCELAKSREMEIGVANTGALLESDDGFAKVAKELALSVIVTGELGRKRAKITVHDGRDGSVLGQAAFPGANPRKMAAEVARTFWSKLGGDVERGRVPPGAKNAQKVVAEAPDDDESAPDADDATEPRAKLAARDRASEVRASADGDRDSGSHRDEDSEADENVLEEEASAGPSPPGTVPPTFDAFIAPAGINRALVYHQDISPAGMRPYGLPLAAAPALHVVWYPISALSSGPIQHLGIEAAIEQAFGLRSAAGTDGSALADRTFGNTVHDYAGGLRYRIPFGAGHQVWISGPPASTRSCSRARATAATAGRCSTSPTPSTATAAPGSGCGWSCPPISPSRSAVGIATSSTRAARTSMDIFRTAPSAAWMRSWRSVTGSREVWRSAGRASCAATSTTCIPRPATPSSWVGRSISTGPSASGWRFCWAAAVVRAAPLKTETWVGGSTQNCVKNVQASWGFQVMDWPGSLGDGS